MNPEHIQQIIDMAASAGESTYVLALLIVAESYVTSFLITGVISGIAAGAYKLIKTSMHAEYLWEEIEKLTNQNIYGPASRERTIKMIKKWKEASKQ